MSAGLRLPGFVIALLLGGAAWAFADDAVTAGDPVAMSDVPPGHEAVSASKGRSSLVVWAGGGSAEYEETASTGSIRSDWDGSYGEFGAGWLYESKKGILAVVDFAFWGAAEDTETWRVDGQVVQNNDLEVNGYRFEGLVGKGWEKPDRYEVNGFVGLGINGVDFDRTNFSGPIVETLGNLGSVGEEYTVASFLVAGHGSVPISDAWDFIARGKVGLVFFNEADNDVFGVIEGSGGITFRGSLGVNWKFRDAQRLGLFLVYELQDLDGDQEQRTFITEEGPVPGVVEWPDNELIRFGAEVAWALEF